MLPILSDKPFSWVHSIVECIRLWKVRQMALKWYLDDYFLQFLFRYCMIIFFLTEYDFYGSLPHWVICKQIISFLQEMCGALKTITWICDTALSLCKDFTQTSTDIWAPSSLLSYENAFQAYLQFYVICKQDFSKITTYSQKVEKMEKLISQWNSLDEWLHILLQFIIQSHSIKFHRMMWNDTRFHLAGPI